MASSRCYCLAVGLILREEEDDNDEKVAENIITSSQPGDTSISNSTHPHSKTSTASSYFEAENETEEKPMPMLEDVKPIPNLENDSKSNSSTSNSVKEQTSIKNFFTPKKRKQASILDYYTASKKFGGNQNS